MTTEAQRNAQDTPPPDAKEFVPKRGMSVLYQGNYEGDPHPAVIAHVWPNEKGRLLNLMVIDRDGVPSGHTRVYRGASVGTWRPEGATE